MSVQTPIVREIFERALELASEAGRQAYLDECCAGRPDVRDKVEALLRAHADVGSFLEVPALDAQNTHHFDSIAERAGTIIGPYKLLEQIGEGGFGVVFMAEQEQPLRRRVALKVIKPGMDTRQVIARFEAERQALALMDHPNIAKVLEAGATEGGRPYFVMELVRGIPINQFCDQNCLTVAERLELFITVCRAVQHAHQKGIIHRDLKPTNALVTLHDGQPVAKVIDFGVAKATGQRLTDKTLFTAFAQMVGTPLYMSPEQAEMSGLDVDTRSDIYSLGVMLYELLTGTTPFDKARLHQAAYDEIRRIIRHEEPPKPSTRISTLGQAAAATSNQRQSEPEKLRRLLRGDLDWIVMKCLEKDRNRRYETANGLAADLTRHLENESVVARPPSAAYRIQKAWRRNKFVYVAGSAIFLALGVGLTLAALGWSLALTERDAAILAREGEVSAREQAQLNEMKAVQERRRAELATKESRRHEVLSRWDHARQVCEGGDIGRGLLLLAKSLERIPNDEENVDLREALRIELAGWHQHCHTLERILPHPEKVLAMAVDPLGKIVVTGCADGKVRVWDLESGDCRRTFAAHNGEVRAIAFNANSDTIITGGTDGEALVWDVSNGKRVGSLDGHRADVLAVAISPDGNIALTGCADKKARLWDLAERKCRKIVDHQGAVRTVGFHPDGRSFFVGGDNEASDKGKLCIMTENDAPNVLATESDAIFSITSAAYSPDGATLVVGDENWEASFYDAASLQRFAITDYALGQVRGVAFSPDSKTALIGARDSNIALLWNMESLRAYVDWQKDGVFVLTNVGPTGPIRPALLHPQPVTAVCFSPSDGQRILTACEDGCVRIWHKSPGPSIRVLDHNPTLPTRKKREFVVKTTAIDPSGRLAATAGDNGQVVLWDVSDGKPNGRPLDCSSPVVSVVFTADGRSVVTGSKDGLVQLWNLRTREREGEPIHHEGGVSGLDICRSNDEILVGGGGLAQRWNVRNGVKIGDTLQHSNDSVLNITTAISPNGKRFLTMGEDGTAKLWNASAGLVAVLTHDNAIRGGGFSRDSTQAITASDDGTARVWDASDGKLRTSLTHQSEVFSAAFVSASRVITCSRQGVQVWDLRFQKRLGAPCKCQHGIFLGTRVLFAACSDDGTTAVLADFNGYGVIWSMPQPVSDVCSSITVCVQNEVGMKLDDAGGRQVLTSHEWLRNDAMIGPRQKLRSGDRPR